jgi:uncharacterized ion transporter superfamily protein YfcC|tara:strand:+ start:88 stop:471 length:384 start_codon:yes stop_codon:yes gene_type:complete
MALFNLLGFGIKAAWDVFKTRQQTKRLEALAEQKHMEKMLTGEIEFKKTIGSQHDKSWKDEFVLIVISAPLLILAYSVFFGDDTTREKLDVYFYYFSELPTIYQWLLVGIFGAIYGLKPGMDLFRKK